MPDIDIDIQDTRRGEVIDYVTEKYGAPRVAQIITFGTMAARNSVRDTGRVLGMSYDEVDAIAKVVPQPVQGRHIPLAVSVGLTPGKNAEQKPAPELVAEYAKPRAKELIDLAVQLEGTIRSNGVHAAGVVIAPEPLVNYTPLQRAQKGGISTQYEMHAVEELGLLKMDFLGLSNLTIINNALRIIRKVYDTKIDISRIPLDDLKTYDMLSAGDTTGVFQLESAGMKRYLRELKPTAFDDIISMVALYRPGPMQWIEDFIERKHGRRRIEYLHPAMEPALKSTYGVIVTQEQAMQISKDMCGFTGGQADTLRKAIGKKDPRIMAKIKDDFINGAIEKVGAERELMEKLWAQLEAFAAYCFNKAHSACYALIAYETAYLKANYPSAYMAALLTSDFGNTDRIAIEVAECQRMGITVLPPDVNESFLEFAVVKSTENIRFGLSAIKNVGTGAIEAILAAREADGPFTSIEDFAKRVSASECNRKVWESLAKSGAFDSLIEGDRARLLHNLETVTAYGSKSQKNALSGQIDIFGSLGVQEAQPALRLEDAPIPVSMHEQLSWERELLGLYLSRHPLDEFNNYLRANTQRIGSITAEGDGKFITIGGLITTVRKITTKNGAVMAFVGIEDKTGQTELIVFPKAYEKSPHLFEPDQIIAASGKISARDREGRLTSEPKIMVDTARTIDYEMAARAPKLSAPEPPKPAQKIPAAPKPLPAGSAPQLIVKLTDASDQDILHGIKTVLSEHTGQSDAYLVVGLESPKKIRLPFKVTISEALVEQLSSIVGDGSVSRV